MKTIIIYLLGCATPFVLFIGHAIICDIVSWVRFKLREPKKGTWLIHSHTNGGTPYDNGGNYSIYRYGQDSCERAIWNPPMITEADALAECARRNAL